MNNDRHIDMREQGCSVRTRSANLIDKQYLIPFEQISCKMSRMMSDEGLMAFVADMEHAQRLPIIPFQLFALVRSNSRCIFRCSRLYLAFVSLIFLLVRER